MDKVLLMQVHLVKTLLLKGKQLLVTPPNDTTTSICFTASNKIMCTGQKVPELQLVRSHTTEENP